MPRCSRRQFLAAAGMTACTLATPPRAHAAPRWVDQRALGPFTLRSTFPLGPHQAVLGDLPELEIELRRVLALRPCSAPVQVELLANKQQHREYLAQRYPSAPYRRALYVKQNNQATVFAYLSDELGTDLRHECTHALLHADLPMVPLWLDEGLAEYFEAPPAQRAFDHEHTKTLMWDLRFGRVEDLPGLEAKRDITEMDLRDYRSAWAWTHFLLHGPRAAAVELWGYLSDIRKGQPPGVMSQRLAAALPQPEQMLHRHFDQWTRLAANRRRQA